MSFRSASAAACSSSMRTPAAGRSEIPARADFFFCGGHALAGLPYCSYHSRVAYQPPNLRRDRRAFRA